MFLTDDHVISSLSTSTRNTMKFTSGCNISYIYITQYFLTFRIGNCHCHDNYGDNWHKHSSTTVWVSCWFVQFSQTLQQQWQQRQQQQHWWWWMFQRWKLSQSQVKFNYESSKIMVLAAFMIKCRFEGRDYLVSWRLGCSQFTQAAAENFCRQNNMR